MQRFNTVAALRARLAPETAVAFVPTMGNLHAGHLDLIRIARAHGRCVVASIFVNPLQFGPQEDFAAYPRTVEEDCAQLDEAGCDVAFLPSLAELYPVTQEVMVTPPPVANELCGAFRPGHFAGVCTVVAKLFNIVCPQVAVFGKKDYQQLVIVRELVRQLNYPITILAGETVRAADGLALSSRNGYLSAAERAEAPRLYRTLAAAAARLAQGERDCAMVEAAARAELEAHGWRVDYVAVRDPATLRPPAGPWRDFVVLGAAWLGTTRLIDNVEGSTAAGRAV